MALSKPFGMIDQPPCLRVVFCDTYTQTYHVADERDATARVTFSRPASISREHAITNPDAMRKLMLPIALAYVGSADPNYEMKVVEGNFAAFRENDIIWFVRVVDYEWQAYDDTWLRKAMFCLFAYEGLYNDNFKQWCKPLIGRTL